MAKKLLFLVAILIVIAALVSAGWWWAANRGLIAGMANSPRPENFKRAFDAYLGSTASGYLRPCATPGFVSLSGRSYTDTRFDWSPAGFLAVLDNTLDGYAVLKMRFEYLEQQGFFDSQTLPGGAPEYRLTWKGYAQSNGEGCFYFASAEREAKVVGFERKRVDNGVDIYEVTARFFPRRIEPWAETPQFREMYAADVMFKQSLDPPAVSYELVRGTGGFTILEKRNDPIKERQRVEGGMGAQAAREVGELNAGRVKAALTAYLTKNPELTQLCLPMPIVPSEADEVLPATAGNRQSAGGPDVSGLSFSIYNAPTRSHERLRDILRGYELLRKLNALGYASMDLLSVNTFKALEVNGGVRFTLNNAFTKKLETTGGCFSVGTLEAPEILGFQPFDASNPNPRFVGRLRLKVQDDADALKVVGGFGHLQRANETGVPVAGRLRYQSGHVQVDTAAVFPPVYGPDISQAKLPSINVPPRPAGSADRTAGIGAVNTQLRPYTQLHAIGVYQGYAPPGSLRRDGKSVGVVNVSIGQSASPVALYLVSYDPVNWVISVMPGTTLYRVAVSGYHEQQVYAPGVASFEVSRHPYETIRSASARMDIARMAATTMGVSPTSVQYSYEGRSFSLGLGSVPIQQPAPSSTSSRGGRRRH